MLSSFSHSPELRFELLKLLIRKVLEIDKLIARLFDCANEFVQFQMNCFGIAVLCVLDKEHHEESDDGCGGVDDQLPGIGKMKRWSGENPHEDDQHSSGKSPGTSESDRTTAGKDAKCITHHAKQISLLFVFL